jgi:hypothetical protein
MMKEEKSRNVTDGPAADKPNEREGSAPVPRVETPAPAQPSAAA